ncbi:hypothetical protein F0562_032108 [Nyssa sinensis]|uniref:Uncharacterized protein n=1 Tax=Nyssa sinensis TaxID=561372 RepID=A0A5J5AUP5_9ASTE|nr:hypothetical protein F0562_032108 [Nyssa sinensis]
MHVMAALGRVKYESNDLEAQIQLQLMDTTEEANQIYLALDRDFYTNLEPHLINSTTSAYIRGYLVIDANVITEDMVTSTLRANGVVVYRTHVARIDRALLFEDHSVPCLRTNTLSFLIGPFTRTMAKQSKSHIPTIAPTATHLEDDFLADDLEQLYIPNPPHPTPTADVSSSSFVPLGLTLVDLDTRARSGTNIWGCSGSRELVLEAAMGAYGRGACGDIHDNLAQSVCKDLDPKSASFVHCDVTKEIEVENAVNTAVAKYGKLDIMFNNAGIGGVAKLNVLDIEKAEFEQVINVNLISGGSSHAYTSSKHAVLGLTRNIAVELGRYGIRVNCVSPYLVSTPLAKNFLKMDDEGFNSVYSNLKGAVLKLEDVAEAGLYLGSDDSKYVSGPNLIVDGGFSIVNSGFCLFKQST